MSVQPTLQTRAFDWRAALHRIGEMIARAWRAVFTRSHAAARRESMDLPCYYVE